MLLLLLLLLMLIAQPKRSRPSVVQAARPGTAWPGRALLRIGRRRRTGRVGCARSLGLL